MEQPPQVSLLDTMPHSQQDGVITVEEFFQLHSLLSAIAERELGGPRLLPESVQAALARNDAAEPNQRASEAALNWAELLDLSVSPHLLRRYVAESDVKEPAIRALTRFLIAKHAHLEFARDKVDWLATNLIRMRQERTGEPLGWPRADIVELLEGMNFPEPSRRVEDLLGEIPSLLDEVKYLERFSQVTDSGIIARGRNLKTEFGEEFFHPKVLISIVNYNLIFGKKFLQLLEETAQRVREILKENPQSAAPDTCEMLQRDYRLTASAFEQLSKLGERPVIENRPQDNAVTPPSVAGQDLPDAKAGFSASVARQLIEMGIDEGRQREQIRNRVRETAVRLRSNPRMTAIATPFGSLILSEWESAALQADYAQAEESFRASFASSVSTAVGIMLRIEEELPAYHETKGKDGVCKAHYDALVFLLFEARRLQEIMKGLATQSRNRGLRDKARQLLATVDKLEAALNRLLPLFSKAG